MTESRPEPAGANERLAFLGVTIVNTTDGTLQRDMLVFVENGKIDAITLAAGFVADRSTRVIDARGKFMIPGYNDLHAHPLGSSDPEGSLTLLLANGVTGFREMGAWNDMLERRRAGTLISSTAPELLELAGEGINPGNVPTPEAAAALVQSQTRRGADFIKVLDYTPAIFDAVVAECKRVNMRFMGHLSPTVDVREAARVGMSTIEHMGPRDSILLGCSTEEVALRPQPGLLGAASSRPSVPAGPAPADVIARSIANPVVRTTVAELARYRRVIDTYSEDRMHDLAAHFVAARTCLVPTLIRARTMQVGDDPRYRNDPNLQYIPVQTKAMWESVSLEFSKTFSDDQRRTMRDLYELSARIVKPFKRAGIPMMAGSDLAGGFVVAGFGLHEEFDLLEQAGLSPLEVLQMTTLDGARFLAREATMGSVAVGKNANLLLLDANPIANVQNLHRIFGVVRAGTYHPSATLASMKYRTAERVAAGIAQTPPQRPSCC